MLWAPWGPHLVISLLIAYEGRRRIGALGALGPSFGHFLINGLSRKEENWCSGRAGAFVWLLFQQLLNMKGGAGGLCFDQGRPRKLTCMELTLPTTYYLLPTTYYLLPITTRAIAATSATIHYYNYYYCCYYHPLLLLLLLLLLAPTTTITIAAPTTTTTKSEKW